MTRVRQCRCLHRSNTGSSRFEALAMLLSVHGATAGGCVITVNLRLVLVSQSTPSSSNDQETYSITHLRAAGAYHGTVAAKVELTTQAEATAVTTSMALPETAETRLPTISRTSVDQATSKENVATSNKFRLYC